MRLRMRWVLLSAVCGALISAAAVAPVLAQEGRAERAPETASESTEPDAETDAEADVVEEGESKVKVFRFSGLDISGRLKSPQLLYFLNRLRAEFDRPRLPHRSFVPELVRSTKAKGM